MKEKKEKKKYESAVQSLNRNPCLPGMLHCPFHVVDPFNLVCFVKEEKRGANN
jgi:hypothetical protein